jgi:hypothetical protein
VSGTTDPLRLALELIVSGAAEKGLALARNALAARQTETGLTLDGFALLRSTAAWCGDWELHAAFGGATRERFPGRRARIAGEDICDFLDGRNRDGAERRLEELDLHLSGCLLQKDPELGWIAPWAAAIASDPDDRACLIAALGRFAVYSGRIRTALAFAQTLGTMPSGSADLRRALLLAEAHLAAGQAGEARAALAEARDLHAPDDTVTQARIERLEIDGLRLGAEFGALDAALASAEERAWSNGQPKVALQIALERVDLLVAIGALTRAQLLNADLAARVAEQSLDDAVFRQAFRSRETLIEARLAVRSDRDRPVSATQIAVTGATQPPPDLAAMSAGDAAATGLEHIRTLIAGAADAADLRAQTGPWLSHLRAVLDGADSPLAAARLLYAQALVARASAEDRAARQMVAHALNLLPQDGALLLRWDLLLLAGSACSATDPGAAADAFRAGEEVIGHVAATLGTDMERRLFAATRSATAVGLRAAALGTLAGGAGLTAAAYRDLTGASRRLAGWMPDDPDLWESAHYPAGVAVLRILSARDSMVLLLETGRDVRLTVADSTPETLREEAEPEIDLARRAAHFVDPAALLEPTSLASGWRARSEVRLQRIADLLRLAEALAPCADSVRTLLIEADPWLMPLPLAALPLDGRPLIERFDIGYLRERPRAIGRAAASGAAVFVFAEPVLDETGAAVLPALPSAMAEGASIARLLGVAVEQAGPAGERKAALVSHLRTASTVHVAAHGAHDARDPGNAGIWIPGSDGGLAGLLAIRDILSLDAPLCVQELTLSVCDAGAAAPMLGGTGIGLMSAFVDAGAGVVSGFSWPVQDSHAPALMTAYRKVRERLSPVAAASLTARDAYRAAERAGLGGVLPAFWAGLAVLGPLDLLIAPPERPANDGAGRLPLNSSLPFPDDRV